MYNKTVKSSILATIVVCSALMTGLASAQVSHGPNGNPYTFTGEIQLGSSVSTYVCELALTGNVTDGSSPIDGFVTVIVTSGTVSGNFPCGLITLENMPWGHTDNGELVAGGAIVDLGDIGATAPFGLLSCFGSISVPFNNDATASDFDFNGLSFGGCTFTGTGRPLNVLFADPSNNVTVP